MTIPSALTAAQTAAAAALVQASLTLPVNTAEIAAKALALADAELGLGLYFKVRLPPATWIRFYEVSRR